MEYVRLFLKEVTEELLYNIVYNQNEIEYHDLSDTFKEKTGHRPTDFFGFGNKTGIGRSNFIRRIFHLQGKKITLKCNDNPCIYKLFNTTYLCEIDEMSPKSVANYREMLLIKCCEIMNDKFTDLSGCKDANGNTPLHLVAGLPGIAYDCSTLVKYLLRAGVDPLEENDDGQTFMHIIFGRFKAIKNDNSGFYFKKGHVATTEWFVKDRVDLLDLLFEELSKEQIVLLTKSQDQKGNTLIHECAYSAPIEDHFDESKIYDKLLKFGASLRISNNNGELPLHYAFNPKVFKFFIDNGAVCRARNDLDETPVLFMMKYLAGLAFFETSIPRALKLLENLMKIFEDEEVGKTAWIPNIEGKVVMNILLIAVRLGSRQVFNSANLHDNVVSQLGNKQVCLSLVKLQSKLVVKASPNDMTRQNNKGKSFLHVLLDMGDVYSYQIAHEAELLQSLEILLEQKVNVNALDSQGRTPLDIVYNHLENGSPFYEKCVKVLMKNGALTRPDLENNNAFSAATSSSFHQSNETRKLRWCPKRHLDSAQRLTDPNSKVAIVEKYRYSSEVPIGSGAFSKIFVAIKDENVESRNRTIECRAYALKRLDKEKKNAEEIKREISTLLSISGKCENIIKCHESVEDPFFQYLSLDLMDGDLHEFVENGSVNKVMKADPAIPVQATNEIIKGLEYLHKHNYIHRDIKPGNILYTTDTTDTKKPNKKPLHFKIADFGLTKNTSTSCTMTSTRGSGVAMAPGTRCWMAPELVSMKSREHTKESDIFSLGLVLHYLLTLGKHPFGRANEEAPHVIERKIAEMQIYIDKSLHPEATSLLQILLTKYPSKRPPATYLTHHPFLWSESKKIEFLKAVGDQQEAETPTKSPNSPLEQRLQMTTSARIVPWDRRIKNLYDEIARAWKRKKYRTDKVIDLIRFIRNAYAHKQERSLKTQQELDNNIFLRVFPSLVLDVFGVVQQLGFVDDDSRRSILQALSL